MKILPCPAPCGATPSILHRTFGAIHAIQIECACGKRGAHVMFTKIADREKCEQAAVDGWNLSL